MSAPEVGDQVRVIAGQWTGWEGVADELLEPEWLWVVATSTPHGKPGNWQRPLHISYLEVIEP